MRRLLVLLLAAAVWPAAASAQERATVEVVKVDGAIDRPMADYLIGSLYQAERDGSAVVIQLDSPGTLGVDAAALAARIRRSSVPVVTWVGPPGSRAAGGSALIAAAASASFVSPGSAFGPLAPLDLADPGETGAGEGERILREFRPGSVVPADPLTAQQALDAGLADAAEGSGGALEPQPSSIDGLLSQLDGRPLRIGDSGETVTLATEVADTPEDGSGVLIRYHDLGPWRRVLHAVISPPAIYLLLVLGLAGIAFEMTQPGFGFAGICALLALALAVYGIVMVPPWWPGSLLLLTGVGMMAGDVLLRRLGLLTFAGLAAFAAGSIASYGGVADAIDISPWVVGGVVAATFLYYGFGLTVALQSRDRLRVTQQGLIGLVGETRGNLDPEGAVQVKGVLWKARSGDGPIPRGSRVRVRGVDGVILRVEPEEEGEEGP
jgi:membrane-bound serine protease (ClpP class)